MSPVPYGFDAPSPIASVIVPPNLGSFFLSRPWREYFQRLILPHGPSRLAAAVLLEATLRSESRARRQVQTPYRSPSSHALRANGLDRLRLRHGAAEK